MRSRLVSRFTALLGVAPAVALAVSATAASSGPPIRIGGTLALTGPRAATALLHKITAEIYVEELNKSNGLLGRPVEWVLLDDQSKPEVTRTLYEKLITVDKVDLLMGPYATGAIIAAMGVAQRYQKMLIHHSFGMPHLAKYEMQFPAAPFGAEPNKTVPAIVFDAVAATSNPPKTVAIVTSKFPSAQFQSSGARDVATQRGLKVLLYLEYEFGTRDFGPIAARIKDANPDLLWVGALGLDGNLVLEELKRLDYTPRRHYHLFPAPGPWSRRRRRSSPSPTRSSRSIRRSPTTRRRPGSRRSITSARRRPACPTRTSTRRRPARMRRGRCSRPR
jgi:ABC-type branched-subunit amino acid transport system substrate-binding protein